MIEEKCKNCNYCSWDSWNSPHGWFCEQLEEGEDRVNPEDFCKIPSSVSYPIGFEQKETK